MQTMETELESFVVSDVEQTLDVQTGVVVLPDTKKSQEPDGDPWLELIQDGAAIMKETLPPLVEVIEGIVAQGSKLVIGSGSKTFKTWLTMNAGLAISHGIEFWGRKTTKCKVLYVNLELKERTFKWRLQKVALTLGIEVDPKQFLHLPLRGKLCGLRVFQIISRIIELAIKLGIGVVIIDPIYKLNTEGDENSSRDQTILFNDLDRITTEAGSTLILNDHFGKGNQSEKDPLDAIRGSSAKGGDVDAAMILRKHEVEGCFSVDLVHRELPPVAPFCIEWEFPLMKLRPDLDAADMKKINGRPKKYDADDLLRLLPPEGLSGSEWEDAAAGATPKIPRTPYFELRKKLVATKRVLESKANNKWLPITQNQK